MKYYFKSAMLSTSTLSIAYECHTRQNYVILMSIPHSLYYQVTVFFLLGIGFYYTEARFRLLLSADSHYWAIIFYY